MTTTRRKLFHGKIALLRKSCKDKNMNTRKTSDPYTTMKIPRSLLRQLRIQAALKNKFLYQLIAELLVQEIENKDENGARTIN
ncbi:MAG: hypothetical protein JW923_05380 [Spirochaetales bacterium]|nr:hypothetical protein [Spirochaetales bacterium]